MTTSDVSSTPQSYLATALEANATAPPVTTSALRKDRRVGDSQRPGNAEKSPKIMIVDDERYNIMVVRKYLQRAGYLNFVTTSESTTVIKMIRSEQPDLVLLDIKMPHVSGLDILKTMRADARMQHVPVLILTAATDADTKLMALERGATDFIAKPVDPSELVLRIRNTLDVKAHHDHLADYSEQLEHEVRLRTAEVEASRREILICLARAAEYRDQETGHHVIRVGKYVGIIAQQLGFDQETVQLLEEAAPLHDVGKIGVSDTILLKPGKLDPDEFDQMKEHCNYGKKIILPLHDEDWKVLQGQADFDWECVPLGNSPVMQVAAVIAQFHHEKWDGSGYPLGLAGEEIPIEGRITAVADVFDALSSERPYKRAFPVEKCFAILKDGRGSHFDPQVLDAFFARTDDILRVQEDFGDPDT